MVGARLATVETSPERQLNGMSIAALCCGLFPVTCFLGIAFGVIAIRQIRVASTAWESDLRSPGSQSARRGS